MVGIAGLVLQIIMKTIRILLLPILFSSLLLPCGFSQVSPDLDPSLQQLHANIWQNILSSGIPDQDEIDQLLTDLDDQGRWPDIDYDSKQRGAWAPRQHLSNVLNIARAYRHPGNRYYQQESVSKKLHLALNYWLAHDFQCPNWWYPEIGVPMVLAPAMILLEKELTEEQFSKGIKILDRSELKMTGQNKVWLAGNVLFRSLLTRNVELVEKAAASIREELVVSLAEGVQPDWSYHQHGPQLQFGNYGLSYAAEMTKWFSILRNTPFQFNESKVVILRNYLLEGQRWVSWKNKMDISACGRQLFIDSPAQKAGSLAASTAKMGQLDLEFAKNYQDANQYETLSGHKHFWRSDFQVQRNPDYYFSVKMCSERVSGAESCNSENMLGYYMGDGVSLLYQSGEEYTNIFPFWDWKKVPGTTIIQDDDDLPLLTCSGYRLESDFVGGVSDAKDGIAVLQYQRDGLVANKSWFMLDGKIVCLGNGISARAGFPVTTSINQSHLNGPVLLSHQGKARPIESMENLQDPDWVLHDQTGYFFPEGGQVKLEAKAVEGYWNRVAIRYPEEKLSSPIFKMWMDHGVDPRDQTYNYILVPRADRALMEELQKQAPFTIVNEKNLQAVSTPDGAQVGMVFYAAGASKGEEDIRAEQACLVLLKRTEEGIVVSVADPTQKLEEIRLSIAGTFTGEYATVDEGRTHLTIPLPREGQAGQSVSVSLKKRLALANPISVEYLREQLAKNDPRLILTPEIEKQLKRKLQSDPLVKTYFASLQNQAQEILQKPLLKRELEGFRLLFVSREMLERMGILSIVYRLEKDPAILQRIDAELQAVLAFEDWNPQHFLDVSEMSLAVALAIDWVGQDLPAETLRSAKSALIEKGILPSFNEGGTRMFWINGSNNWNAVCHGGLIAAALVIADEHPELAAKTISRALEKLPNSLKEYAPDGVYPEGPSYWGYGTSYTLIASNVLTTALGSDFGISASPGFMESANFRLLATAPSGDFFNFADSADRNNGSGSLLLSWFAAQTGDELYFDRSFFEQPKDPGRFAGPGLVWLSQFSAQKKSELPPEWHGKGANPIAVFRGDATDPSQFFLGMKGGKAHLSHGNMDAGTFVFDLNGVRWVLDPGNQRYYLLNKIGFNLSGHCQDCERWTLLTKKNQGHSTLTVNDARFQVEGHAPITHFKAGDQPEVTIDLTEMYGDLLHSAQRRFVKESNQSIIIEDQLVLNDSTENISWGLMTTADVQPTKNGAILSQDGKKLQLSILSSDELSVSIISLAPPPLEIDKTIEHLKRIEIRVPAYLWKDQMGTIRVRLSAIE